MLLRKSLKLPIILAIVMIVLLIVLTVGWVWVTVAGALKDKQSSALYWSFLSIGSSILLLVLAGTIVYLTLSIKAINLTRRQSNFIDSVTHELKSPIASLKLYLQTLGLDDISPAEQAAFRQSMLEDVERLDGLINHLLDAGRLDRDSIIEHAEPETVELSALLREAVESVCLRYRVPTSIVTLDVVPVLVPIGRGDLEIIFRNLIDNAVKYAGAEPAVHVWLRVKGEQAVVRVADNGAGIPPQLRRKIFGRFVRVGLELERKKPGTGLGLYIVRNLVRRHKGDVRLQDPEHGSGSVFEVRLPGARVPDESPAISEQRPADEPAGAAMR